MGWPQVFGAQLMSGTLDLVAWIGWIEPLVLVKGEHFLTSKPQIRNSNLRGAQHVIFLFYASFTKRANSP